MKKSIFILTFLFVGFLSAVAQQQNPPTNCAPILTLAEFANNPSISMTFLHTEVSPNGGIAYVYEYSCHGVHYPKRCRKKDGVCGKGKSKFSDIGDFLEATVSYPISGGGFTAEVPCPAINDCDLDITFD